VDEAGAGGANLWDLFAGGDGPAIVGAFLAATYFFACVAMPESASMPLLRTRVGLDALLGVVPVAGDLLSAALGVYLVAQARELGASRWLQARMIGNLAFDALLGVVPVAGDIADVYFKAHLRNLRLLQKELGEPYLDLEQAAAQDGRRRRGLARRQGR